MAALTTQTLIRMIVACLGGDDLETSDVEIPASALGLSDIVAMDITVRERDTGTCFRVSVTQVPRAAPAPADRWLNAPQRRYGDG